MKKFLIPVLMLAGILTVGYFYFFRSEVKEYLWRSAAVEQGSISIIVNSTGTVNADTSVDVGTQVSGTIAKILMDYNSIVKKGQVLAVLDTTLLYANKVDAVAAMERAKIQLDEMDREYKRAKKLYDEQVLAKSDYDVALTNYQTARRNSISADAQLTRAKINLQYATIRSPISGVVISRNIQVGNMVIASFNSPTLFTIVYDLKKMQVQANVDEADIGQIRLGQEVKFTVNAFPNDVFTGTVIQIRHQPFIVQNVVNYVVIVAFSNPEKKLIPGMTANLNIAVEKKDNVLKVPSNAFTFTPPVEYFDIDPLLSDSLRNYWLKKISRDKAIRKKEIVETNHAVGVIWVVNQNHLIPVEVTKGISDGSFTEIAGEVSEGQEVALGINHSASASGAKSSNPFMPKFPRRR